MEIKAEIAFKEAMEELNELNNKFILERSMRKQLEIELERLLKEIEDLKKEK